MTDERKQYDGEISRDYSQAQLLDMLKELLVLRNKFFGANKVTPSNPDFKRYFELDAILTDAGYNHLFLGELGSNTDIDIRKVELDTLTKLSAPIKLPTRAAALATSMSSITGAQVTTTGANITATSPKTK